jgi:hypothetical protein
MEQDLKEILLKISISLDKISNSLELINKHLTKKVENIKPDKQIFIEDNAEELNEPNKIEDENKNNETSKLASYFANKQIILKSAESTDFVEHNLSKLANFIGNKHNLILPFLEKIKSALNNGQTIKMDLKYESPERISAICQLGKDLQNLAFLTNFFYRNSPVCALTATPNRIPEAINFLSGKWAEIYISDTLKKILLPLNNKIYFEVLINPVFRLPDSTEIEIDILLLINNELYLFEVKTGTYQKFIQQFKKIQKYFKIDSKNCFLILTNNQSLNIDLLSNLYNLNFVEIQNFKSMFLSSLNIKLNLP